MAQHGATGPAWAAAVDSGRLEDVGPSATRKDGEFGKLDPDCDEFYVSFA